MNKIGAISIVRMQEIHLKDVFEIAQKNKLSYWSPGDYKSEILRTDSYCLVAKNNNDKTTGFTVSRLIMQAKCAEVYNIAVKDDYKRKGIGKILFSHLVNYCIINNLDQINLEVRESNESAVSFYLKLDFKRTGIRKNFYTQPVENAITMIKYLV